MKHIRIVSPAKAIEKEHLIHAQQYLEENGFKVSFGKYAFGSHHYFSGTDKERLKDLQKALDDSDVDAILCARGGYGIVRIIDGLNFKKFEKDPKLVMGYSDVTVLHNHIQKKYKVPTLHCSAPLNFIENSTASLESIVVALNEGVLKYNIKEDPLNIGGEVKAKVVGGNLSILASLIGTDSDINMDDKILFFEEIGEAVYAMDRMLYSLKKGNKLNKLKGVIVGGMTNIKDSAIPFGQSAEEVIYTHFKNLNIPICFGFPSGHIQDNRALFLGKEATLKVTKNGVTFKQ